MKGRNFIKNLLKLDNAVISLYASKHGMCACECVCVDLDSGSIKMKICAESLKSFIREQAEIVS